MPVVQQRIGLSERLVILFRCPLALPPFDIFEFLVKRIDLNKDVRNVNFHKLCQPETLPPGHSMDSDHVPQQLDHFLLDPRPVTKGPLASLVREALQLHVQPKPVGSRIPCSVELDPQALIVEGVEHILERRPVVSIAEVLAVGDGHRLLYSTVDRRQPIKPGCCFWLNQVSVLGHPLWSDTETMILTMLVGGGGFPPALALVQKPHWRTLPHSPFTGLAGPPLPAFHSLVKSMVSSVYPFSCI